MWSYPANGVAEVLTIASAAGASVSGDGKVENDPDLAADEGGCCLSWRAGSARAAIGVFALAAA